MLQEVHCSKNTTDSWTGEWGYKALFSCCSSSKAGVFNNNFNLNVIKTLQDPNGRFIICDIEADGNLLTLPISTLPTRMILISLTPFLTASLVSSAMMLW